VQLRWKMYSPYAWSMLVCIAMGWGGVLFGHFQYDDYPNILNDPATKLGPILWERLAHGIRPLSRLTYAMDFALWGNSPRGWFATNFLLHLATTFGVWRLARCASVSLVGAWVAAVIFALQPAHGSVVAYISGRSSALMAALLVWALVAYEFGARQREFRGRATVLTMLLFFAACLAKEVALIFPLLLILWEYTKPNREPAIRTPWQAVAPFMLAGLAFAAYALSIPRYRELLTYSINLRAPIDSLIQNLTALPLTASLLVRPWALSVEHPLPTASYLAATIGAAIIVAWFAIALIVRRTRPMLTLGLLWPLIALLPTHSFIAKVDSISESPLYLAWVGPAIAIGAGLGRWLARPRGGVPMRYYCVGLGVVAATALCAWRTAVWSHPVRLWQEAVRSAPQSSRAWNNLGMAHLADDHVELARYSFREALRLEPTNTQTQFNLELTGLFNPPRK
jgi:protein O-mannosyl-transferase